MTARTAVRPALSEGAFQTQVLDLAALRGWRPYHTHDSRRSHKGWPDLVLARPPRLIAVELKTDTGRLTPEQRRWLIDLEACGLEVDLWRPRDLRDTVVPVLSGTARTRGTAALPERRT